MLKGLLTSGLRHKRDRLTRVILQLAAAGLVIIMPVAGCGQGQQRNYTEHADSSSGSLKEGKVKTEKIVKSDDEWKEQLSELQYNVTRKKATERAFTGIYYDHHEKGMYTCVCCGAELFASGQKYDSGCGWPSYWAPVNDSAIDEHSDTSYGMIRTEIVCARCGAHLGHVFEDGPQPTGLRYCVNSASLKFKNEK